MTINSVLHRLSSSYVLSDDEKSSITTSIINLKSKLSSHFGDKLARQFVFGSYGRGTILPRQVDPNSDVDHMCVFSDGGDVKPPSLLSRLRTFADRHYPRTRQAQSAPAVVLDLNHIRFELVPARETWLSGLQIPAPASDYEDWTSTDPAGLSQRVTDKNKGEGNYIKPVIRLLKAWNTTGVGKVMSSYEIEEYMVGKWFFMCSNYRDYFSAALKGISLSWSAAQYKKDKLDRAKTILSNAESYEDSGDNARAEREIRKLFP